MKRWVWIPVVGAAAALTWLSGGTADRAAASSPGAALSGLSPDAAVPGAVMNDSVRISHELIQVDSPPGEIIVHRPKVRPAFRKVSGNPRGEGSERRTQSGRLLARAGRVLIGDGRHRPQPFPRPAD